jgi:hypothetical protein
MDITLETRQSLRERQRIRVPDPAEVDLPHRLPPRATYLPPSPTREEVALAEERARFRRLVFNVVGWSVLLAMTGAGIRFETRPGHRPLSRATAVVVAGPANAGGGQR